MPVTILDIAREAGVSPATVSRVINNSKPVSEETRNRILKAIENNNFKPNSLARGLIMKRTNVIGVILPDISNKFFSEMVKGIDETLSGEGYSYILCNSDGIPAKEINYLTLLIEKQIDGVILSGVQFTGDHKKFFSENEIDVLFVGQEPEDINVPSIDIDNFTAAYEAVKYLIELGHREIGFISGPMKDISAGVKRLEGYKKALKDNNIQFRKNRVAYGNFTIESGFKAMKQIFDAGKAIPTAVFAADDMMAIGAIDYILDNNLAVPQDISVMGFDDTLIASAFRPALTTINHDSYNLGVLAASSLLKKLNKEEVENRVFMPHKIIARNSTRSI